MSEAAVQQRLREQRLAQLEKKKKSSNKSRVQNSDVVGDFQDEVMINTPQDIVVAANASCLEADSTLRPQKRQKNELLKAPLKVSKSILESASSSSIALGKNVSSHVTLHAADEKKLSTMNSILRGEEVMAFATQILLWSREQVAVSKVELDQLSKLEKAADDAHDKASSDQQKLAVAEERLKKLEADAVSRENEFKKKISSLEKQLQNSEKAKLDAEANWYGVGLEKRMQMVKDAKLDFTKCMFDYELEEWQLEQADAEDGIQNGDIGILAPNAQDDIIFQEDTGET